MRVCDEQVSIPFFSASGALVAKMRLIPFRPPESGAPDEVAPLVELDETSAGEHGETMLQLRESERYEYEIVPEGANCDLRLRCSLARRHRSLGENSNKPDAGLIETRSYCGTLLLELVEGETNGAKSAIASALIDVRSLKLDYRTQYRGMLRRLSEKIADLVADSRSSAKAAHRSTFETRSDAGWLQVHIELLREALDGPDFSAALQRIIQYPHEQLSAVSDSVSTDRPIRWSPAAVRQLATRHPRRDLPPAHPLRANGIMNSVAGRVLLPRNTRNLDTPENRFVKFALGEFRSFLAHAQTVFEKNKGWEASAALARRLTACVEDWLGRALFGEIGALRVIPLGSPVLQQKAGYREILHWWLRFRTAAEISWKGGEDVFRAGQRDIATLYEYWLFFELLDWFCKKCRDGKRPPVESLIEGLDEGAPNLRLKKRTTLESFEGAFAGLNRKINARFSYNRVFEVTGKYQHPGSWTRKLHPDYTLTFWPSHLKDETEAEKQELLVHVHLDAKYRVENIEALFGADNDDDVDNETEGNYKRQDLLKMHAYRDAIKRSQGAYVLYPGDAGKIQRRGLHEILPGLGAFAIAPDGDGNAKGMPALEKFLDDVLNHLANRTTAQERASYHTAESYLVEEDPVPYGNLQLQETDIYGKDYRALPPAEHMVLVAWFENKGQLELARLNEGFAFVRLGDRRGSLHAHPNLSQTRHILLRSHDHFAAPGLLALREPGFDIYTRTQLRAKLDKYAKQARITPWQDNPAPDDDEYIYALFKTKPDPAFANQRWNPGKILNCIETFEADLRNKPSVALRRDSPYPRILPLRDLLTALL